jgi:hypothetical protein
MSLEGRKTFTVCSAFWQGSTNVGQLNKDVTLVPIPGAGAQRSPDWIQWTGEYSLESVPWDDPALDRGKPAVGSELFDFLHHVQGSAVPDCPAKPTVEGA